MRVIIIAAGSATRLGEITNKKPKGLLEINGKSIIKRQIELFKKNKIEEIVIITGPYKDFGFSDVVYVNDENHEKHDVLGSLMAAKNMFNGKIITSYSDLVFEEKILQQLLNFNGDIGIPIDLDWEKNYAGRNLHPKSEADNVLLKEKIILKIKKNISKNKPNEVIGEFLGPMVFSEKGSKIFVDKYKNLEKINNKKFHDAPNLENAYVTDMIQELIDDKIKIEPIFINGKWCEIDTVEDIERAEKLFSH